ncbi:sigma-70 family RNA polymerase sigma factor [Dactylosporangium aurantiacum]|uniref:Sigma-70 family RNA polymerase sigma factor n=1 Tax=Dactylosporangium aurantiacum TaxID=35754 RepID=A0A9Q9MRS5_9ACTN|nr:sigma-70 family RNA polymerase sigma factor [Dactylosporangium aurantiacum]MDG6104028.1 sigma-70 family RNA polymerase sigma factor [Dactylosporangium aurantiacum]UWZ58797.1 sigma-70 family RNA polymerase sigma factor [Dactylosporangium aurantiacum]
MHGNSSSGARRRRPDVTPQVPALLHRAQLGDRNAFAELYRTYHEPVTRYVNVRMRDRDRDAIPDLVQEAFTGALTELSTTLLDVRGWCIIQAAKTCMRHDWSRRRYTRAAHTMHRHAALDTTPPPVVDPAARPEHITFVHAMARLTAAERRAIQLRYLDDYPRDAAARLMDRSPEAMRCLERRALRRMRATFTTAAATS